MANDLRFGIEYGGRRSGCYRIRSGAHMPELFIEREGTEDVTHVSLHKSKKWHIKVNGKPVHVWCRPDEFHPGYTRAMAIIQSPAVATAAVPAPTGAHGLALIEGSDDAGHFDVYLERPGADMSTWPGMRGSGTMFVGRLPLAQDEGTCCVVARRAPLPAMGPQHIDRPPDDDIATMRRLSAEGRLLITTFGDLEDGTFALIDGRIEVT